MCVSYSPSVGVRSGHPTLHLTLSFRVLSNLLCCFDVFFCLTDPVHFFRYLISLTLNVLSVSISFYPLILCGPPPFIPISCRHHMPYLGGVSSFTMPILTHCSHYHDISCQDGVVLTSSYLLPLLSVHASPFIDGASLSSPACSLLASDHVAS